MSAQRYARLVVAVVGALGVVVGVAAPAHAQSISGTLAAELTLTRACLISGVTGTTGLDFGRLDFGSQPATFTGVVTAQAAIGGSNTQVVCSPDVTGVTVIVGAGLHGGNGGSIGVGSRALALGGSYVPYEVYTTAGFATNYPTDGSGVALSIPTPGTPFTLPIFGRINKTSSTALTPGIYADTLQITIQF